MSEPRESRDLDSNHLVEAVRRRGARHALWRADGERSFAQNLAMIGALGWLIVTPTLMGLFLGRWLDHVGQSGIFWTGALLVVGLALGCWLAWRRMMAP
jgi:ATP synthase protein I